MAIVRSSGGGGRVPRLEGAGEDGSPEATEDEDEQRSPATASDAEGFSGEDANGGGGGGLGEEAEDEPEEEEHDSGMGSDELEVTQLGEAGAEMCQVGDQSVALPLDLCDLDLPDLGSVLSLDAWNGVLAEDDRLRLAAFLPDLDQETFARTLVELLSGHSFHFGSPLAALFDRLKGGLCDPRIVLYRRGARFAERRKHYYHLQSYHNAMVRGLWEAKDCWKGLDGYGLDQRLRALDAMKAQRKQRLLGLGDVRAAGSETDSESRGSAEQFMARPKPDKKKAGKEKSKGLLRLGGSKGLGEEYVGGSGRDAAASISELARQHSAYGYDTGVLHRGKPRRSVDGLDSEDLLGYDRELPRARSQKPLVKPVKKKELATAYDSNPYAKSYRDNHTGSHYHGRNAIGNQGVTLAASFEAPYPDTSRSAKYMDRDQIYGGKSVQNRALKAEEMDWPAGSHADNNLNDWQRGQPAGDYRSRVPQVGHGVKVKSYRNIEQQMNGAHSGSDPRDKVSQGKSKVKSSSQYGRIGQKDSRSKAAYVQSEETESDSSEQFEDGADMNLAEQQYPELHRPYGAKKPSKHGKTVKMNYPAATADFEPYQTPSRGGHRGKVAEPDYLRDVHVEVAEQISEVMRPPSARSERKRKGMSNLDMHGYDSSQLHDSNEKANESFRSPESERPASRTGYAVQDSNGDFDGSERVNVPLASCSSGSKRQKGRVEVTSLDEHGEYTPSDPKAVEISGSLKKKSKKKADTISDAPTVVEPAPVVPEVIVVPVEPEKPKKKYVPITPTIHTGFSFSVVHLLTAVKKAMVTPSEVIPSEVTPSEVTPSEDTSVAATVTATEIPPAVAKQPEGEESRKWFNSEEPSKTPQEPSATEQAQQANEVGDASVTEQSAPSNSLALTVQEIVNRVKTNPGDPNILETQEPLQDLVRGVLKILSSRTAPLGAKGWKSLVSYDKSNKSWFWVGPLPSGTSYSDPNEETSAEAWGIPHKMLVKLVDAFANWLKSGQETLKQIGSLPAPPPPNPANLDLKERFKDLRAQKSLNTISPSSDEARTYFQREEFLRYSIPDRAFCYTAADGEKSIVAPLRRGGGKPTAKARGHPMLLPDRPPHVTILCLVRDAASRLPGRTGTRADVCTLLKDSQYLNHAESNKEAAVNQVVSGALDRLHYERDPCVLYDNDKKLWTYLHRGREEEDFEDDGTSSTKKWKRPRKDSLDPSEAGAGNDDLEDDGTPNAKKQKKDDAEPTASGEDKDGVDNIILDPSIGGLEGDFDLDVVLSSTNNATDAKTDIGISRPSVGATAGNTAIPEQFYSMAIPVDSTSKEFNNA